SCTGWRRRTARDDATALRSVDGRGRGNARRRDLGAMREAYATVFVWLKLQGAPSERYAGVAARWTDGATRATASRCSTTAARSTDAADFAGARHRLPSLGRRPEEPISRARAEDFSQTSREKDCHDPRRSSSRKPHSLARAHRDHLRG